MIEVVNVSKAYDDKEVLKDISFKLDKGSFNMIVGGNGSGKSTLINIIGSLLNGYRGDVFVDGININDYNREAKSKKISILKQANHINLDISVSELVSFGRYPYSKGRLNSEDHKIVENCLHKTKTYEFKDRSINKLSGGQRQRAFLAMILAQDTDVILLDEPLSSLDLKHSVDFVNILKDICRENNKTILMIVHDLNVAAMAADKIIALKDGKLEAIGSADEVIECELLYDVFGVDFSVSTIDNRKVCFVK